ncbi:hypothetical protein CVT24_004393 [Panaeolus cyanescens]|uniref:Uncharacterized protein n=1 Tax=Panaeolus cyanescens TaxID=181874 RepID=A0A409YBG8_9AGAR|nr:hypothetical protein CVT24_004393 [Panaeolus cyanescens]
MSIAPGIYTMRFIPPYVEPPFDGGMYATASGYGEPIRGAPNSLSLALAQKISFYQDGVSRKIQSPPMANRLSCRSV